jgi:hypothetical protein
VIDIKTRLERSAAVLSVIDYRRQRTGDRNIGSELERFILDRELKDLAEKAMAAPLGSATAGIDEPEHRSA